MDKDKIKLIIRNMELLLDSLKAEVFSDNNPREEKLISLDVNDYDEVFSGYED